MSYTASPIRRKPVAPPSPTEGADTKREQAWADSYDEKPRPPDLKGKGKEKTVVSAFDRLPGEIIQECVLYSALSLVRNRMLASD